MEMINSMASFNKFGSGGAILRARVGETIDDATILARCPSVFAEQAHESRSDRYAYLPTRDLLSGLRSEGFFPVEVRQGGSKDLAKRGFTKHMLRLRRDVTSAKQVGDSIPEVCLINSHDGTSSYNCMLGFFRLVCLNGMVVPDTDRQAAGIKVGHRGQILDEVIEASYRVIQESEQVQLSIAQMTQTDLTMAEQIAFADAARSLRFEEDAVVTAEAIIRPRRQEDVGSDLWRVFSRAQENLVKGGVVYRNNDAETGRSQRRQLREVKSIDGNVKLNKALWTLAEKMLELKVAA